MVKKDGGPAFPAGAFAAQHCPGMTLRDWFAGQVLAGMMSNPYFMEHTLYDLNGRVAVAYHHADAMLAERER